MWCARLDVEPHRLERFERLLSTDERVRAGRYRTARHRARFVARRAMLRMLLARFLGEREELIEFDYGSDGKPCISEPECGRALGFNLSHSGDVAVFGLAPGATVGIDVERVRDTGDLLDVSELCFSPRERTIIRALPRSDQCAAFYRCWTRKEAYVKALGCGLSAPLDEIDVAFGAREEPAVLRVGRDHSEPARWRMQPLALPAGYVGAVAVGAPA